jgi:hypothetical protein
MSTEQAAASLAAAAHNSAAARQALHDVRAAAAADLAELKRLREEKCQLCGHLGDWHRLDDAQGLGPGDPGAKFRCLGYDCTRDGTLSEARARTGIAEPPFCWCPNMMRAEP